MLHSSIVRGLLAVVLVASAVSAHADVFNLGGSNSSLSFVTVGDPGNVADSASGGTVGTVPYTFQMGTYDVTLAQYTAFLNAVAKTDTYGLYNSNMVNGNSSHSYPSGISQGGVSGSYTYAVIGNGNMPVFDETWGDAARFCNWLQNGQPTGPEGLSTTESGDYYLNGATTNTQLMAVASPAHSGSNAAKYFLPTENEWYKAAYYVGGGTNAGYWTYPTQSNIAPTNSLVLAPSTSNEANFSIGSFTDPVNYLTPVGTFSASPGPYGTYDMGGDVYQWNETDVNSSSRGERGGFWDGGTNLMASSFRFYANPSNELNDLGFRVASSAAVPEPGSLALLLAGGLCLLGRASRRRRLARTAKPAAIDEQAAATILSFPSHSPSASAARRAA